jgi:hypothetical protein
MAPTLDTFGEDDRRLLSRPSGLVADLLVTKNACQRGPPAPLLIRDGRVVRQLESATTLPVGFGGEAPRVREHTLQPGDHVLCYTDGLIEEHVAGGQLFGEERLIDCVNRLGEEPSKGARADLRRFSHTLKSERGGHTSDDATLCLRRARQRHRQLDATPARSPSPRAWDNGHPGFGRACRDHRWPRASG